MGAVGSDNLENSNDRNGVVSPCFFVHLLYIRVSLLVKGKLSKHLNGRPYIGLNVQRNLNEPKLIRPCKQMKQRNIKHKCVTCKFK